MFCFFSSQELKKVLHSLVSVIEISKKNRTAEHLGKHAATISEGSKGQKRLYLSYIPIKLIMVFNHNVHTGL